MSLYRWSAVAFLTFAWSTSLLAQTSLPAQCLKSFPVKDQVFSSGTSTVSCLLTEARRGELFARIIAMGETGEIDGTALGIQLAAIEAQLEKEEKSKNWSGLTAAITGNALATIGLSSCLPTDGVGCALAAIGKILATVGVIDSATSEADKMKFTSSLRKEVEVICKNNQNKKSPAKAIRDRMISEFTQLCDEVHKKCL